jgi:hypothetical protein
MTARPIDRRTRLMLGIVVLLTLFPPSGSSADDSDQGPPDPAGLDVAETAVRATGLTPGGESVVFAVGRLSMPYLTRVIHWQEAVVADDEGALLFEVSDGVPAASVWVVAEPASGVVLLEIASEAVPPTAELPPGALRASPAGGRNRLVQRFAGVRVLFVRPGVGAWAGFLADGGSEDADGETDGSVEIALERLEPVGSTTATAPESVAVGDRLVVIDPSGLESYALVLGLDS